MKKENRPLIKHYTESILYDIELTARNMKLLASQFFSKLKFDIASDEYCVLDVISCHSGICQRDLAKLIFKDRANTGRILNSLEEKGLITRFVDTKNNRLVRKMAITEEGYKKLKRVNDKFENYLLTIKGNIPEEEVDNLQTSLRKFRLSMEKLLELNI